MVEYLNKNIVNYTFLYSVVCANYLRLIVREIMGRRGGSNSGDYQLPRTYRLLYSSKHVDTLKTLRGLVDVGIREAAGTFGAWRELVVTHLVLKLNPVQQMLLAGTFNFPEIKLCWLILVLLFKVTLNRGEPICLYQRLSMHMDCSFNVII